MKSEILPCPFCGLKKHEVYRASFVGEAGRPVSIACTACGCTGPVTLGHPRDERWQEADAISEWNQRAKILPVLMKKETGPGVDSAPTNSAEVLSPATGAARQFFTDSAATDSAARDSADAIGLFGEALKNAHVLGSPAHLNGLERRIVELEGRVSMIEGRLGKPGRGGIVDRLGRVERLVDKAAGFLGKR